AAIGSHKIKHLPARRFDANHGFSGGNGVDVARVQGAVGYVVEGLFDDPAALQHLARAHHDARQDVALRPHVNLELKFAVNKIGPVTANVSIDSRSPGDGTDRPVGESILHRQHSDLGAAAQDAAIGGADGDE